MAATAVAPRQADKGEKSVALGAHSSVVLGTHSSVVLGTHPSVVLGTHCSRHCDTCLTAQECLRDEVFSARASMFISPSSQVLVGRTERAGVTAAKVPAGADVDAAEAAARRLEEPRQQRLSHLVKRTKVRRV